MNLRIGHKKFDVASVQEAQGVYERMRDASCAGASTFPIGFLDNMVITYNGCVWCKRPANHTEGLLITIKGVSSKLVPL